MDILEHQIATFRLFNETKITHIHSYADRWRSELDPGEIARIESMLHRQMEEFGYKLEGDGWRDTASFRTAIRRGIYVGKRGIARKLRFFAWRICHSLGLIS